LQGEVYEQQVFLVHANLGPKPGSIFVDEKINAEWTELEKYLESEPAD
jgi:hypothetical protein